MSVFEDAWARGFRDDKMLLEAYSNYSKILLVETKSLTLKNTFLDISVLPAKLREAFLAWMIYINKDRIAAGDKPIMTLSIALKCPIWKIVKPTFSRIALTKEEFGKMKPTNKTVGTINSKPSIKSINR